MTLVIINADDFGLTPSVNAAIIDLFERGAVTSTTALATAEYIEPAIAALPSRFRARVGVHLCLDEERPLSDAAAVPTLIDPATGLLQRRGRLLRNLVAGRVSTAEIYTELKAQVGRLVGLGIAPDHFDSHGHIHAFPPIARVVARLMDDYGVIAIRRPVESFVWSGESLRQPARIPIALAVSLCGWRASAAFFQDKHYPAAFSGLLSSGHTTAATIARLAARLRRARLPSVEIMCHPGISNDDGVGRYDHWRYDWRSEFDAIRSVPDALFVDDRLRPAAFGDLANRRR